jgi:hypothetical protein
MDNSEHHDWAPALAQCPITRPTVAICGYPVRRAGCLNRALRLAFGLRMRTLLILHTREIGLRCRQHAPQPDQPLTVENMLTSGCQVERRVREAVVPLSRRAGPMAVAWDAASHFRWSWSASAGGARQ